MQSRRTVRRKGTLLFCFVALSGCTAPAPDEEEPNRQPGPRAGVEAQPQAPAPKTPTGATSRPGPVAAGANEGPCETISASDAHALRGLQLAGRVGTYSFFAEPRALLCSEPGAGGIGECEIVGSTTIRIESGGTTYGLRSRAGVPAILRYGPEGISCISPR